MVNRVRDTTSNCLFQNIYLECFFDKKDWRLCTATTEALKKCMEAQQTERRRKHNLSK